MTMLVNCMQKVILCKLDFVLTSVCLVFSMSFALACGVRWKVKMNAKLNWIHQWMEQTVTLERYVSGGKAI